MTTEVIAVGDEMTSGARVDTNSAWLSRRLGELGHEVTRHTTIADEMQPMVDEFAAAIRRSGVVVVTGGLGPTRDDLTREAIAAAAGRDLQLHAASLRHIESMFARREMPMPPRNVNQAMLPAGAEPIENPGGTAPGIDLQIAGCRLFALPGVPAEMRPMFDCHIAPALLSASGGSGQVIRHRVMKFFGIGESDMESRLGEMIARGRRPRIGITASGATISLRITAIGADTTVCEDQIATAAAEVMTRVGELHFGDGERTEQHDVVGTMLAASGRRMVTIEIGGGAPLAGWFAGHGGQRAVVASLAFATAADFRSMTGADSDAAAAVQIVAALGADLGLVINAYPTFAEDESFSPEASATTFWIHRPGEPTLQKTVAVGGHPSILRPRIAKTALAWVRQVLGGSSARAPQAIRRANRTGEISLRNAN